MTPTSKARPRLGRASALAWLLTAVAAAVACHDTTEPDDRGAIMVRVTTSTSSSVPKYDLVVDQSPAGSVTVGATLTIRIAAGTHVVELAGVPADCAIENDNPTSVYVVSGVTAVVAFAVDCGQAATENARSPAWSPDGSRIAFTRVQGEAQHVYVMESDRSVRRLTQGGVADVAPTWLPDGARIAFTRYAAENTGAYIIGADGTGIAPLRNLSGGVGAGLLPTWSPDGRRIAYMVWRYAGNYDGVTVIYAANADGSGAVQLTTESDNCYGPASWSPDGQRLALACNGQISTVSATGGPLVNLTQGNATAPVGWNPAWSPDGLRIAFVSTREWDEMQAHIYVMNADGTDTRQLTFGNGDDEPAWSPDGTRIAFTKYGDYATIWVVNADGTGRAPLIGTPP